MTATYWDQTFVSSVEIASTLKAYTAQSPLQYQHNACAQQLLQQRIVCVARTQLQLQSKLLSGIAAVLAAASMRTAESSAATATAVIAAASKHKKANV
jgi:hypothetical protein